MKARLSLCDLAAAAPLQKKAVIMERQTLAARIDSGKRAQLVQNRHAYFIAALDFKGLSKRACTPLAEGRENSKQKLGLVTSNERCTFQALRFFPAEKLQPIRLTSFCSSCWVEPTNFSLNLYKENVSFILVRGLQQHLCKARISKELWPVVLQQVLRSYPRLD